MGRMLARTSKNRYRPSDFVLARIEGGLRAETAAEIAEKEQAKAEFIAQRGILRIGKKRGQFTHRRIRDGIGGTDGGGK